MKRKRKKIIAVWFSCGVASAVAAKKTIEKYGKTHKIIIVNTPIKEEHEDNQRFLKDVSKWLGYPIKQIVSKQYPNSSIVEVFDDRKYMSGIKGAPCTMILKKQARYEFECLQHIDFHVLGFTYDEKERFERFVKFERANTLPILIDEKITKKDCFLIIQKAGIEIPKIYKLGFPNANCIGCVKSQSPTYWNLVRKHFPDVFFQRSTQSNKLNVCLVRLHGKRIHLSALSESDIGGRIKSIECGLFCR